MTNTYFACCNDESGSERGGTEYRGPKTLSETVLSHPLLIILAGMLFCSLLCWKSQIQLSIFVVSYALPSFLIKLYRYWDRDQVIWVPDWASEAL